MTPERSRDPARHIALIALNSDPLAEVQMLEAVILYAFDQLCWRRTGTDLGLLVERLRDGLASDDAPCTDCGGTGITYQTERRCACTLTDEERRAWQDIREGMNR